MAKEACYLKFEYTAKPDQVVYFLFNWGVLRTLPTVYDRVFWEKG